MQNEMRRLFFLFPGMLSLLAGLGAALFRGGIGLPFLPPSIAMHHGILMVSGFVGTVIGLERAVALNRSWLYIGPVFSALGALLPLTGFPAEAGAALICIASLILSGAYLVIFRIQREIFVTIMFAGALCWALGNILWLLSGSIQSAILWWIAFPLFTVAGERLELNRFRITSKKQSSVFFLSILIYCLGAASYSMSSIGVWEFIPASLAARLSGAGTVLLTFWLLKFDVILKNVRKTGQFAFSARAILLAYAGGAVSGLLMIVYGLPYGGPIYDSILHTLFLGFMMSMIFAHAPMVFTGVLGVRLIFTPAYYSHLLLLQFSLVSRVAANLLELDELRKFSLALNALSFILFIGNTLISIQRKTAEKGTGQPAKN